MKQRNNIFKIIIVSCLLFICASRTADAQQVSISTNAITWANFGTMNLEGAVSVSKHFTVFAGVKYNPWEFTTKSNVILINNQITGYAGAKYWPWHVYSGWWFGAKAQFQDFDQAGFLTENLVSGQALGMGLSAGYTFMLSPHFNIDLGLGGWGGRVLKYTGYEDVVGLEVETTGSKNFVFLDSMVIAIAYIF